MNAKRNISAASGFRLAEDDDPAPCAGLINQRRGRRGRYNYSSSLVGVDPISSYLGNPTATRTAKFRGVRKMAEREVQLSHICPGSGLGTAMIAPTLKRLK